MCCRYIGESREKDDLSFMDYTLTFEMDGSVKGTVRSNQKTFVVSTTLCIFPMSLQVEGFYHRAKGKYLWGETDNSVRQEYANDPLQTEVEIVASK